MIPNVQRGFSPTKHQCHLNSGGDSVLTSKNIECLLIHYKDQLANVAWDNSDCTSIYG